ncbi:MAG: hypothetical protein ABI813_01515 [Bacteroidota bacterium]
MIANFSGHTTMIDSFEVEKLSHLIFSFCHLKVNLINMGNALDSVTIQRLVVLKSWNTEFKLFFRWVAAKPIHPSFLPAKLLQLLTVVGCRPVGKAAPQLYCVRSMP